MAGLIPALQAREHGLQMAYMTPDSQPLVRLEAGLAQMHGLPAVLVVDQFEELFTLCHERKRRLHGPAPALPRRRVVVTMRADFWGDCAAFPIEGGDAAHQESSRRWIGRAAAGHGPAGRGGRPALRGRPAQTVLDDVQGEPGAMPLLQHALLELWRDATAAGSGAGSTGPSAA